ncbi:cell wall metabolism sensor histidine kinase WalK [Gottschalkiaceae bacterium SANA]|nr:cell wall metabolism sensor histidine kinase WalK [Gottschalkiaceae bacterium SANA]
MFKSIRWRLVIIYFLLVFIAVTVVGVFILDRLRSQQEEWTLNNMLQYAEQVQVLPSLRSDEWVENESQLVESFTNWPIAQTDQAYLLSMDGTAPRVLSNSMGAQNLLGKSAYETEVIDNELIFNALNGEKENKIKRGTYQPEDTVAHLVVPLFSVNGEIKGLIYVTSDLEVMNQVLSSSRSILFQGMALALLLTVILGSILSRSITLPIQAVTKKASKMAEGDFDQKVDVKSNDELGQLAMMFNSLTDELKKTISQLSEESSKMEALFTNMADGLIAIDPMGKLLHANPVARRLFVIDETEEEQNVLPMLQELRPDIQMDQLIASEDARGELMLEFSPEDIYRAHYAPFLNDKGERSGLILVFQDITEQNKLEIMRREFVANVSHELKTPITTIKSYTETIMDGVLDDKELSTKFLGVIDNECDRMTRIVRDLLQLSSMDYQETKWELTEVCLQDLLEMVDLKMKISAQGKKQQLRVRVEPELPCLTGNRDALEQVVLNVISNAIKYTQDGGAIDVHAYSEGSQLRIRVRDNGSGIPQEDLDRIFERFYRVNKARSRAMGGTGLGLSIAKQIVELHGGNISIQSVLGEGTVVEICFREGSAQELV